MLININAFTETDCQKASFSEMDTLKGKFHLLYFDNEVKICNKMLWS